MSLAGGYTSWGVLLLTWCPCAAPCSRSCSRSSSMAFENLKWPFSSAGASRRVGTYLGAVNGVGRCVGSGWGRNGAERGGMRRDGGGGKETDDVAVFEPTLLDLGSGGPRGRRWVILRRCGRVLRMPLWCSRLERCVIHLCALVFNSPTMHFFFFDFIIITIIKYNTIQLK
jgi:hypothetical protein